MYPSLLRNDSSSSHKKAHFYSCLWYLFKWLWTWELSKHENSYSWSCESFLSPSHMPVATLNAQGHGDISKPSRGAELRMLFLNFINIMFIPCYLHIILCLNPNKQTNHLQRIPLLKSFGAMWCDITIQKTSSTRLQGNWDPNSGRRCHLVYIIEAMDFWISSQVHGRPICGCPPILSIASPVDFSRYT